MVRIYKQSFLYIFLVLCASNSMLEAVSTSWFSRNFPWNPFSQVPERLKDNKRVATGIIMGTTAVAGALFLWRRSEARCRRLERANQGLQEQLADAQARPNTKPEEPRAQGACNGTCIAQQQAARFEAENVWFRACITRLEGELKDYRNRDRERVAFRRGLVEARATEIQELKSQVEALTSQLRGANDRIRELQKINAAESDGYQLVAAADAAEGEG